MSNLANNNLKEFEKEQPIAVKQIVSSLRELHEMGRPHTDHEVEERINQYFELCERTSIRPGVESLCLALHISRTTLFRWNMGEDCSEQRTECIRSAKSFIASFLEQASMSGKLNPATSIFLMKNWLNYKDSISLEQSANEAKTMQDIAPSIPDMARKYITTEKQD